MPLVRFDVQKSRSVEEVRAIADAVHFAIVAVYGIPARDRFQVINRHEEGEIIAEDAGLGFERTSPVIIQIFTQEGRSAEAKQELYATITSEVGKVGVAGEDIFISYVENTFYDWSFGLGRAQYVTGELAVPQR